MAFTFEAACAIEKIKKTIPDALLCGPLPSFAKASEGKKNKILNIKIAHPMTSRVDKLKPGTVIKLDNDIAVATKKCYLILKQVQLEGGKEMDAESFLNGHPDFLGSVLE